MPPVFAFQNLSSKTTSSNQFQNRRFSTCEQFLGLLSYQEHLYVIEPKLITVFQFYPHCMIAPQLVEQRILSVPISHFALNRNYFCIICNLTLQIRNRKIWEEVCFIEKVNLPQKISFQNNLLKTYTFCLAQETLIIQTIFDENNLVQELTTIQKITLKTQILFPQLWISNLHSVHNVYGWIKNNTIQFGYLMVSTEGEIPIIKKQPFKLSSRELGSNKVKAMHNTNSIYTSLILVCENQFGNLFLIIYNLNVPKTQQKQDYQQLLTQTKYLDNPQIQKKIPLNCSFYQHSQYEQSSQLLWVVGKHMIIKILVDNPSQITILQQTVKNQPLLSVGVTIFQDCLITKNHSISLSILSKPPRQSSQIVFQDIEDLSPPECYNPPIVQKKQVTVQTYLEVHEFQTQTNQRDLYQQIQQVCIDSVEAFGQTQFVCLDFQTQTIQQGLQQQIKPLCIDTVEGFGQTQFVCLDFQTQTIQQELQQQIKPLCIDKVEGFGQTQLICIDSQTQVHSFETMNYSTQTIEQFEDIVEKDKNQIDKVLTKFSSLFLVSLNKHMNRAKKNDEVFAKNLQKTLNETMFQAITNNINQILSQQLQKTKESLFQIFNNQLKYFNSILYSNEVQQLAITEQKVNQIQKQVDSFKSSCLGAISAHQIINLQSFTVIDVINNNSKELIQKVIDIQNNLKSKIQQQEEFKNTVKNQIAQIKELIALIVQLDEQSSSEQEIQEQEQSQDQSQSEQNIYSQQNPSINNSFAHSNHPAFFPMIKPPEFAYNPPPIHYYPPDPRMYPYPPHSNYPQNILSYPINSSISYSSQPYANASFPQKKQIQQNKKKKDKDKDKEKEKEKEKEKIKEKKTRTKTKTKRKSSD